MRTATTIRLGDDERRRLEDAGERFGLSIGSLLRCGGLRLAEELLGHTGQDEEQRGVARGGKGDGPP